MKLTKKPLSKKPRGFTLVELLVVIAIIAALASISSPIVLRQIKKARQAAAINNAKDIHKGFLAFNETEGRFPDDASAAKFGTGTSNANEYFHQFYQVGVVLDEKPFYIKSSLPGASLSPPDGDVSSGKILEAGENIWSYFLKNGDTGLSLFEDGPNSPLIATPLTSSSTYDDVTVEPKTFGKRMISLRLDGSVATFTTNAENKPIGAEFQSADGASESDFTAKLHDSSS